MPTTFRVLIAAVALTIYGAADSVKTRVPAILTIATTDQPGVYRWRTVYANDTTKGMKDYRQRLVARREPQ